MRGSTAAVLRFQKAGKNLEDLLFIGNFTGTPFNRNHRAGGMQNDILRRGAEYKFFNFGLFDDS